MSFDIMQLFSAVIFGEQAGAWSYLPAVALRVVILYFFSYFLLRLMGKRENKQITIFDAVVIVALGGIIANPLLDFQIPIVWPMAILAIFLFIERGFIFLVQRSNYLSDLIESKPALLVKDGIVDFKRVRKEKLGTEELYSKLRVNGIRNLGEIERAYLEESGEVSVFKNEEPDKGLCLFPEDQNALRHHHADDHVPESKDYSCWKCGKIFRFHRDDKFTHCPNCKGKEWGQTIEP